MASGSVVSDLRGRCWKRTSQAGVAVLVFFGLFSILVWDLRKVQMLSSVIHDDHTDRWIKLGLTESSKWWRPLDMCMMNMSSPEQTYGEYKEKNCSGLHGSKGSSVLNLACGAGATIGSKSCLPPLDSRLFFNMQLRNPILGNASNELLSRTLRHLAHKNRPVVFVGDGISKQNQEALLCEILRTDRVTLHGNTGSLDGNYTIHWKEQNIPPLGIHYMKLTAMFSNGEDEGINDGRDQVQIQRFRRLNHNRRRYRGHQRRMQQLSSPNDSTAIIPNSPEVSKTTPIPLSLTLDEIKDRVEVLTEHHPNGIVLIVNCGVWYNSRELFRLELPYLLSWMEGLSKNKSSTVFFRETAAQHWNHTSSGYFDRSYIEQQYDNGTCTPVLDSTPEMDWRNTDIYHMIDNDEYKNILIIPFRELTLPLHNMHPTSSATGTTGATQDQDCTHFCYFPQMWQTVWYRLYKETVVND